MFILLGNNNLTDKLMPHPKTQSIQCNDEDQIGKCLLHTAFETKHSRIMRSAWTMWVNSTNKRFQWHYSSVFALPVTRDFRLWI